MRSAWRRRRKRRARASSRDTPALSIDPAGVRKRDRDADRARARRPYRARRQRPSRRVDAASSRRRCFRSRPMWSSPSRSARGLPKRSPIAARSAIPTCRQPLPHRRRRPADVVGPLDHLGRPIRAAIAQAPARRHRAQSIRSSARSRSSMPGPACSAMRVHRMPQIGEISPGSLAGERVRRSWPQHHGDGRTDDRARDRRRRRSWRLFLPYELVWAGGKLGRAGRSRPLFFAAHSDRDRGSRCRDSAEAAQAARGSDSDAARRKGGRASRRQGGAQAGRGGREAAAQALDATRRPTPEREPGNTAAPHCRRSRRSPPERHKEAEKAASGVGLAS